MDEEATRLADVLEDHLDAGDVTDAGDIVFTAVGSTWVLHFQHGEVFQSAGARAPVDGVLRDIVVPALLARPAYRAATADDDTLTVHPATATCPGPGIATAGTRTSCRSPPGRICP
ncbi:hypothetical protein [Streptomyces sp. NPDC060184]|uniref:hypothetical protein n=1 Tax=Streptomyces sp. NPDC060184 TaxID=3347064 RepID=UPI00366020E2